jgi:poly [ADP-ribose] polymerase
MLIDFGSLRCHVLVEDGEPWNCMLNQTNIQNNNNKFYIIQLLKEDSRKAYYVFMRWGRVGYKGQLSGSAFGQDLDSAKRAFQGKFMDKTRNSWEERHSFKKVAGKYDLVHMDYNADDVDETVKKEENDEETSGSGKCKSTTFSTEWRVR